jgi:hypothetical protein
LAPGHPPAAIAQESFMSRFIRIVGPVVAALAIVLGGATSALAASGPAPSGSGAAYSWDLDAEWCFDDVVFQYCFDVTGKAQFVERANRSSVVTHHVVHTVITKDGAYVGESTVISNDRFAIAADGTYTQRVVELTRSQYDAEVCRIAIVWRQADFETVVDHWSGSCA